MSVRKRKDTGRWICDFYYNGERIVRTLKFARTKRQAEQAEAVLMSEVFQQAYGIAKAPDRKFEDFVVETFLPYSETNKKSFRCDVQICKVLVSHFKGTFLRNFTPQMIENFKQVFFKKPTRHGKRRSPATVNYHLSVLSKIFSMAIDQDVLEVNPCKRVKRLRLENQRMRVLSESEEEALLEAVGPYTLLRHVIVVALNTGLRKGEILALKWDDIDFEREVMIVKKSKSGRPRIVPLNNSVLEILGGRQRNSRYVFPNPKTGKRLKDVKRSFSTALRNAGIKDFRFHDLRHTAATRMADRGADAFTLMKILGHSDIRMTSRYTHATDRAIHQAVRKLDKISGFSNVLATERGMSK